MHLLRTTLEFSLQSVIVIEAFECEYQWLIKGLTSSQTFQFKFSSLSQEKNQQMKFDSQSQYLPKFVFVTSSDFSLRPLEFVLQSSFLILEIGHPSALALFSFVIQAFSISAKYHQITITQRSQYRVQFFLEAFNWAYMLLFNSCFKTFCCNIPSLICDYSNSTIS
ncbi:hypothetical protein FGO68_gene3407 [Halteria grandinella]|uniref:Uncharacterized protein n=1 Tax=Halteria grandinella TaxID=5974 RepID=A0A8J8P0U4_HALGN|nr:hypothetical protein FGO68_gene3407 [Halteria grandinella]